MFLSVDLLVRKTVLRKSKSVQVHKVGMDRRCKGGVLMSCKLGDMSIEEHACTLDAVNCQFRF